ncbi:YezD family protein [Natranaerofaba carboxydovora]|nr:YezD family protein [Natranaerofaba carboxydovora]
MSPKRKKQKEVLEKINEAIEELEYGQVTVVIQDSKVVQIEKTEKVRFV